MTNKIYLSFNRLYLLKDGDYHGAKMSYRIKHGDQVIAEGERAGKSLSRFITPVDIEEMEITNPLTVEYVCTGNVEEVSAFPAISDQLFLTCQSGQVFIKDALLCSSIITNAHLKLANDASLIGGKFQKKEFQEQAEKPELPEIMCANSEPFSVTISWQGTKNIKEGSRIQVQWVKDDYFLSTSNHKFSSEESHTITGLKAGEEIHCQLRVVSASGQKSEWSEFIKQSASTDALEMIDHVLGNYPASMVVNINTTSEKDKTDPLKKLVSDIVTEALNKQQRPGGFFYRK